MTRVELAVGVGFVALVALTGLVLAGWAVGSTISVEQRVLIPPPQHILIHPPPEAIP